MESKITVLELNNVHKAYRAGPAKVDVLKGVNLTIAAGEMVALLGPSGSGKTTLLQIAGLLDSPDSGEVVLTGEDLTNADDKKRTQFRKDRLGFVYQFHHLLPEFTALENVMMPLLIQGMQEAQARDRATLMLREVGLETRVKHRPGELSGGEQQRVAIARALVTKPMLLIADEPTGNLDPDTSAKVFDILLTLCREHQLSVLMATHNMELADKLHRKIRLHHGILA